MRRRTRLALGFAVLLVALFGGYGAYWSIAAGRIEAGIGEWAKSLRLQNLDLSWRAIRVGGFPFVFRVELDEARLSDGRGSPGGEVHAPLLSGSARPWNFMVWRLAAPDGLRATAGPADRPVARLSARAALGSVAVSGGGGAVVWLGLSEPTTDMPVRLAAHDAGLWLILPSHQPQAHSERGVAIALDITGLTLPAAPAPLPNPLDEIAVGATVMGAIPAGPPRKAAAAWRDDGGTLELDHFALRWGRLALSGSGTLALDQDLQPIAALSGAIEGYEELTTALVAGGLMRAGDAGLARLALGMLARRGPNGRPAIATSFRIQNGEMYLGPAKLGPAPRIAWE